VLEELMNETPKDLLAKYAVDFCSLEITALLRSYLLKYGIENNSNSNNRNSNSCTGKKVDARIQEC